MAADVRQKGKVIETVRLRRAIACNGLTVSGAELADEFMEDPIKQYLVQLGFRKLNVGSVVNTMTFPFRLRCTIPYTIYLAGLMHFPDCTMMTRPSVDRTVVNTVDMLAVVMM